MTKPLIDLLVDRFLACPLPGSVKVDPCAMPEAVPYPYERTGTNLLNAVEAKQMLGDAAAPLLARVTDLETEVDSVNRILIETQATRHDYRTVLERMANDGCGSYDITKRTNCRDRSANQDEWCWSCIAAHTLNG